MEGRVTIGFAASGIEDQDASAVNFPVTRDVLGCGSEGPEAGRGGEDGGAAGGGSPSPRPFTCPPIGQLHPSNSWKSGTNAKRIVQMEVAGAIQLHGAEFVGLLTLGCPGDDRISDVKEFSKRFDSFNANCLTGRFKQWLAIIQRHKDGTIHAHVVVVGHERLGAGGYWSEKRRRHCVPPTAHCRALWEVFSPSRMAGYGLGVANLLPVQDPESCGRYVTRYVARELGTRKGVDRFVRLVRYSQSWHRVVHGPFSWSDWSARRALHRAHDAGTRLWGSFDAMVRDVGPCWKFHLRRTLYCGDEYGSLLAATENDLEYFNGPRFALEENWRKADARLAEMKKTYPWLYGLDDAPG